MREIYLCTPERFCLKVIGSLRLLFSHLPADSLRLDSPRDPRACACGVIPGNLITSHPAENLSHDCSLLANQKAVSAASHIHTASVEDVLPRKQSSAAGGGGGGGSEDRSFLTTEWELECTVTLTFHRMLVSSKFRELPVNSAC